MPAVNALLHILSWPLVTLWLASMLAFLASAVLLVLGDAAAMVTFVLALALNLATVWKAHEAIHGNSSKAGEMLSRCLLFGLLFVGGNGIWTTAHDPSQGPKVSGRRAYRWRVAPLKYTEIFLADLDREVPISRRVLERFPEGKFDWKPHEKSMPMGYIALMVATIPEWLGMIVDQDELDIAPKDGPKFEPPPLKTAADFVKALDASAEKGRAALRGTNDEHLATRWKLLSGGKVIQDTPRHIQIRDGVLSHWAHHRGQLSVYYKMLGIPVPSHLRTLRRRTRAK